MMKKITLLFLLTALPLLVFGQTTIETYTFDSDVEGFVPGNASQTSVNFDAANYFTAAGSIEMGQLEINKVIKKTGISTITELGDYTLKFKIKGTETGANIKGNIRTTTNYAGVAIAMNTLPSSTGADGATWYEYSTTVTVATLNLTNSQIQIQTNTLGTYYIDDMVLIKEPLTGNVLTIDVVGGGTVAANPDQVSYADGTSVQLTPNPSTHWNFDSWSGDLTGSSNPANITMDADKAVTATFVIDPTFDYDFTFDTDGELEGWTPDNQLPVTAHTGGLVTLTTVADGWARFDLNNFPIPATVADPAKYNKVTIKLQNPSATTDELAFAVTNAAETTTIAFPMSTGDATIQTYDIDMTQFAAWSGDVTTFRIRFADADNPSGSSKPTEAHNIIIDDITFSFDVTLGVDNVEFKDDVSITLYPNPVQDVLNISAKSAVSKIEIYNVLGQKVLSKKGANQVNISGLNKGAYITKIFQENDAISTKRFIKN